MLSVYIVLGPEMLDEFELIVTVTRCPIGVSQKLESILELQFVPLIILYPFLVRLSIYGYIVSVFKKNSGVFQFSSVVKLSTSRVALMKDWITLIDTPGIDSPVVASTTRTVMPLPGVTALQPLFSFLV